MQLGELQHQIDRFERRSVSVVALSVDEPTASLAMIERLGLTFELGSDPQQTVVKTFGVQNPTTRELAIHAVYIIDTDGTIFYRKVGRRRPVSQELIDAIDAFQGQYPRTDEQVRPKASIAVAFPENNFQALITIAGVSALPTTVDPLDFSRVYSILQQGRSDDSLIAFKALTSKSRNAPRQDLYDTAAWLTRQLFFADKPEAMDAGLLLRQRLTRIRELEAELQASSDENQRDELLHTLARARAGLSVTRAEISKNASAWNLRYAKATLRSYREVARASAM
ncbi:MAG: redoxin domain-containing protein [Gammaproteobacteria bacterium]|nr:redoxin domain-containing protein [Gammaproteobacteria bacterium]